MITEFKGEYAFLSNFHPCVVQMWGLTFHSSEAAFQAAKCDNPERRVAFCSLTAAESKRLGREVVLRPHWDVLKVGIMRDVVLAKFTQNDDLRKQLLATGDTELVEGNRWGDVFWGVSLYRHHGENHLGKILMGVREELRECHEIGNWTAC